MMENINDVLKPVLGKYYLVPCAKLKNGNILPIINIKHKDQDFAPNIGLHYHYDSRFYCVGYTGERYLMEETNFPVLAKDVVEISIEKKKYVSNYFGLDRPERFPIYVRWAKKMLGKSCEGRICPHLKAKMILKDGKLICPMHNLIGCPKSEKIESYGKLHVLVYDTFF